MLCQSRIDALDALHHIIGRIKRQRIFTDDVDRDNLTEEEYSLILKETNCQDPFRVAALNVYRKRSRGRPLVFQFHIMPRKSRALKRDKAGRT
jgi:hypothetical protein